MSSCDIFQEDSKSKPWIRLFPVGNNKSKPAKSSGPGVTINMFRSSVISRDEMEKPEWSKANWNKLSWLASVSSRNYFQRGIKDYCLVIKPQNYVTINPIASVKCLFYENFVICERKQQHFRRDRRLKLQLL